MSVLSELEKELGLTPVDWNIFGEDFSSPNGSPSNVQNTENPKTVAIKHETVETNLTNLDLQALRNIYGNNVAKVYYDVKDLYVNRGGEVQLAAKAILVGMSKGVPVQTINNLITDLQRALSQEEYNHV